MPIILLTFKTKRMAFNGNEGEQVTLAEAAAWTKRYRTSNPTAIKASFYGVNKINDVLNQPGVVGIRFYNGEDQNGVNNLILVGVDANEDDITTGIIMETGAKCPPYSGVSNQLNS